VTSEGLDVAGSGTSVSWSQSLDGLVGDGWSSRRADEAPAFEARLRGLGERLAWMRRPADPPAPGDVPVLLHPDVVEAYVLSTLFHNLGGSVVDHGEGAFCAAQFGSDETVFRDDVALRVDPLVPLRSGSYRFTPEGVAAEPCTFVDRGRLIRPVLDRKYARRLGLRPTAVPYGYDTVHLEGPPSLTEREAVAASTCTVLSVLGVHTQDRTSGDFSLSAPQIVAHRDGRRTGRLRGTIAGNLFALLRADDLRCVRFAGEHTPGLLVRCRLDAERP
jgi:PmbA protein